MTPEIQPTPRTFSTTFWLLLFLPSLLGLSLSLLSFGAAGSLALPWLILNFVFSNLAARRLVHWKQSSFWWMFLWWPLCFFLNLVTTMGGCVALEPTGRASL